MRIFFAAILVSLSAFVGVQQASAASQQIIGSNYESFTDLGVCNSNVCLVSFPAIPAGKTILVTRVICRSAANTNPIYMFFGPSALSGSANLIKESYFETISSEYYSSSYYSTHESSPLMMIGPGRFPTVRFQVGTTSNINLRCSLAGTVVQ